METQGVNTSLLDPTFGGKKNPSKSPELEVVPNIYSVKY